MIPIANRAKANWPAIGRSASAACAAVPICVMPLACSVAAVASMMASAMRLEKAMPSKVSARIRRSSFVAAARRLLERLGAGRNRDLLGFLRALPEEKIGADGGPEHRDDGQHCRASEVGRPDHAEQRLGPIDVHQQYHPDISEQAEGQPFEDRDILAVGDEQLEHDAQQREADTNSARRRPPPVAADAAIADRSAPMLMMLAMSRIAIRMPTTRLGKLFPRLLARPAPVTRPMWALTSWTADISG